MRILLTLLILSIPNFAMAEQPSCEEMFKNYRNNPFQWVYPEHYYKAEVIEVSDKKLPDYVNIDFHGFSALIPAKYTDSITNKLKNTFLYKSKSNDGFFISLVKTLGNDEIVGSERDFYKTIFTMTPDDITPKNETLNLSWTIHQKGAFFKTNNDDLKMYKSDNFIAYVRNFKGDEKLKSEITIFHNNLHDGKYLSIGVMLSDKDFVENFLSSLK